MLVCGTARTGKSYLISAIAHALGNECLLTGTTGMASVEEHYIQHSSYPFTTRAAKTCVELHSRDFGRQ